MEEGVLVSVRLVACNDCEDVADVDVDEGLSGVLAFEGAGLRNSTRNFGCLCVWEKLGVYKMVERIVRTKGECVGCIEVQHNKQLNKKHKTSKQKYMRLKTQWHKKEITNNTHFNASCGCFIVNSCTFWCS